MASKDDSEWKESNRSSVVGDGQGSVFIIGFDNKKDTKIPERLQKYNSKPKTAEDLAQSQSQAEQRRKAHEENKAKQARKVREEAVKYDKLMQARVSAHGQQKAGKWYSNAFKGD